MSQAKQPSKTEMPTDGATSEGAPSTEFRPVEGGGNMASGEVLLVEAYAFIWLCAFALVLASIRKQRKLDARISQLEQDLHKARGSD